jgi:hypothetical protein
MSPAGDDGGGIIDAPEDSSEVGLVPFDVLCAVRGTRPEQILTLAQAGLLSPPAGELVRPDYLGIEEDPPPGEPAGWQAHVDRELGRYRDGERRVMTTFAPGRERQREQQLMRMGSAAWGAGLAFMMQGRSGEADRWLDRAATLYRLSLVDAEPGSWGRSIGALKARLLSGDRPGARREARWTLELGALDVPSLTAVYAGALSLLVLDHNPGTQISALKAAEEFPPATAASLAAITADDRVSYERELRTVLRTFEERSRYLEDVPVADTVLALQAIARPRGLHLELSSPALPAPTARA